MFILVFLNPVFDDQWYDPLTNTSICRLSVARLSLILGVLHAAFQTNGKQQRTHRSQRRTHRWPPNNETVAGATTRTDKSERNVFPIETPPEVWHSI